MEDSRKSCISDYFLDYFLDKTILLNCFALCKTQSLTHMCLTTMHGSEMTGAMYCQCVFSCGYFTRSTIPVQICSAHIFLFPIWLCKCALTRQRLPPACCKAHIIVIPQEESVLTIYSSWQYLQNIFFFADRRCL